MPVIVNGVPVEGPPDDLDWDDPEAVRNSLQESSDQVSAALGSPPIQIPEMTPERLAALKRLRQRPHLRAEQ